MTPLRKRVMRALVLALMTLALTANVAAADEGGPVSDVVPYDPGLPGGEVVPYDPGLPGGDEAPPLPPAPSPNTE